MTSKLNCPVCNHELYQTASEPATYCCLNKDCTSDFKFAGAKELWQALIKSQRDLQTAVQALKDIQTAQGRHWGATDTDIKNDCKYCARKALEQIEHKE